MIFFNLTCDLINIQILLILRIFVLIFFYFFLYMHTDHTLKTFTKMLYYFKSPEYSNEVMMS